jgi:hypothetical protein
MDGQTEPGRQNNFCIVITKMAIMCKNMLKLHLLQLLKFKIFKKCYFRLSYHIKFSSNTKTRFMWLSEWKVEMYQKPGAWSWDKDNWMHGTMIIWSRIILLCLNLLMIAITMFQWETCTKKNSQWLYSCYVRDIILVVFN